MKSVILIGATGLVGSNVLEFLLQEKWVGLLTVFARKNPVVENKKLVWETIDFENIEKYKKRIQGDILISTFGTTMKKAGYNKGLFYRWDAEFPLMTAQIALKNGCSHFLFVSAIGASEKSPVFYSHCKGKMERLAIETGFKSVDIFRPSMLIGKRAEFRLAEKISEKIIPCFNPVFTGPLQLYHPVEARDVAYSIVRKAQSDVPGVRIHTYRDFIEDKITMEKIQMDKIKP